MTKLTGFQKSALTVAAVLIAALFVTGPATFGGEGEEQSLRLQSHEVHGSQVQVKVTNVSSNAMTGQVVVEAVVNGETVTGFAGVTVFGNQSATVTLGFPADIQDIISVEAVGENPNPF